MFLCRIIIYDKCIVIPRTWSACQHSFAVAFFRAMLLDGYTCKSPPPAVRFTSVHACGRLIVRAGLQTSQPTHPSAPVYHAAAGSPVINFSFTAVIINSAMDNYWPDASGDIHLFF